MREQASWEVRSQPRRKSRPQPPGQGINTEAPGPGAGGNHAGLARGGGLPCGGFRRSRLHEPRGKKSTFQSGWGHGRSAPRAPVRQLGPAHPPHPKPAPQCEAGGTRDPMEGVTFWLGETQGGGYGPWYTQRLNDGLRPYTFFSAFYS